MKYKIQFLLLLYLLPRLLPGQSMAADVPNCNDYSLLEILKPANQSEDFDSTVFCFTAQYLQKTKAEELDTALFLLLRSNHIDRFEQSKFRTARQYAQLAADSWLKKDALRKYSYWLYRVGLSEYRIGNIYDSFSAITQSIEIAKRINYTRQYLISLARLTWIYNRLERYEEALETIQIYRKEAPKVFLASDFYLAFYYNASSTSHEFLGDFEKAKIFIDSAIYQAKKNNDEENLVTYLINKSSYYKERDSIPKGLTYLRQAFAINQKYGNKQNLGENYRRFGDLFLMAEQYDSCIHYLKKGLILYDEIEDNFRAYMAYGNLAKAYAAIDKHDLAYQAKFKEEEMYFKMYDLRDLKNIFNLEKELASRKANDKINTLTNEKNQKEIALQKQRVSILIGSLLFLLLAGFIFFYYYQLRQKQKLEKIWLQKEAETQIRILEKKALRAQMNPHFIFNSLNSIKSYIASNEPRTATRYLNKFARLMRIILGNSEEKFITVEKEIEGLQLYIELEQFRLKNSFDFEIIVDPRLLKGNYLIPPLIIQPYAENAIWHGLVKKEGEKFLAIKLFVLDESLHIDISDNGIGRAASKLDHPSVNKSFGMKITRQRLELNNHASHHKDDVQIIDLSDSKGVAQGTLIKLKLPLKNQA